MFSFLFIARILRILKYVFTQTYLICYSIDFVCYANISLLFVMLIYLPKQIVTFMPTSLEIIPTLLLTVEKYFKAKNKKLSYYWNSEVVSTDSKVKKIFVSFICILIGALFRSVVYTLGQQ